MSALLRLRTLYCASLFAGLLSGCEQDMSDLEAYVETVTSRTSDEIDPAPEIKPYVGFIYEAAGRRNPFLAPQVDTGPEVVVQKKTNKPQVVAGLEPTDERPDPNRKRGKLEKMPLDSIRVLGIVEWKGRTWALARSSEPFVYRVTAGDYLGRNHGLITEVTESEVRVRELISDGFGSWQKRQTNISVDNE